MPLFYLLMTAVFSVNNIIQSNRQNKQKGIISIKLILTYYKELSYVPQIYDIFFGK